MPSVKVGVTFFSALWVPENGRRWEGTFHELYLLLSSKRIALPPGDDGKTPSNRELMSQGYVANNYRHTNNAHYNTVVCLDLDKLDVKVFAELLKKFTGFEAYLYTTFSNRMGEGGQVSARILFPLSRPLQRTEEELKKADAAGYEKSSPLQPFDEWRRLFAGIQDWTGFAVDRKTKDPARQFFVPTTREGFAGVTLDTYQSGEPLDVDALIQRAPPADEAAALGEPRGFTVRDLRNVIKKLERGRGGKALEALTATLGCLEPTRKHPAKPYCADDGHGHRLAMSWAVATLCPNVAVEPAELATVFMPTFALREKLLFGRPAREGFDEFIKMLRSDVAKQQAKTVEQSKEQQGKVAQRVASAFKLLGEQRDWPITPEEAQALTDKAGGTEEFQRTWVIQKGSSYYFRIGTQYHDKAYTEKEMQTQAAVLLAPASSVGVVVEKQTQQGTMASYPAVEISANYGTVAEKVIATLKTSESFFDYARNIFVKSYARWPNLEPERSDLVEEFFHVSYGEAAHKVLRWGSFLRDLTYAAPALHVWGPANAGKNLLTKGFARIYGAENATPARVAFDKNNGMILTNAPLILSDEKLIAQLRDTATLREAITATQQTIADKYILAEAVQGALRFLFLSNKKNLFKGAEDDGADDYKGVARRILRVQILAAAGEWLSSRPWASERLVEGAEIAKHLLWLRSQMTNEQVLESRKSGLIGGGDIASASDTTMEMITRSPTNSLVLLWVARALVSNNTNARQAIWITGGRLFVSPSLMLANWAGLNLNIQTPSAHSVQTALVSMSDKNETLTRDDIDFFVIDRDVFEAYATNTSQISKTKLGVLLGTDLGNSTSASTDNMGRLITPTFGAKR